tara:strand:+ start:1468 stop:1893 length:426 start_codon:yes stop_codon:yes gene_type:complete
MDIDDIEYEIKGAVDQLNSAKDMLACLPENLAGWLGIEEEFGDPQDVRAQLCTHRDVSSGLEYHGINIDTEAGIAELMRVVESAKKKDEVSNAISQFVSALTSAGILPRTEPVPTPVSTEGPAVADNVVSTAPFTTNQTNN